MREELPKTWLYACLEEVALVVAGNPAPQGNEYFDDGVYNFVRVHDMGENGNNTFLRKTRDLINDKAATKLRLFPSGSILFTKSGASTLLNQRAILAKDSYVVSHIAAAIPFRGVENKWLFHFLKLIDFATLAHATNMPSLPLSRTKTIKVPIAPANEQHRIVAKIEELFSELDKGVESLKTARAQLDVYRQAVLKHAFEGKLTARWREENKDKLETPEQLLARIKQERAAHYERQLKEWRAAVKKWEGGGKRGGKPNKPRDPKPLAKLDESVHLNLPQLPESWAWEKLGWMTCGVEYGTAAKSMKSGTVPVLRMGNIQNAKFDWTDLAYTSNDDEIAEYLLRDSDVLFNRTNSPELVGKTAIYRGERPAIFAGYLIRVNQIRTVVKSQYVNLFLNSDVARQYGNSIKTDGVNQSNINGAKLSNYPFPYCSIEEQREIVSILEKTLSLLDDTEGDISQELQQAAALRQSILKTAFAGQLVAQDPHDEPASVLLDRIRAEREKTVKNKTTRKTIKKRKTAA